MKRLFLWGVRTSVTIGHPLRWLGKPAMRPYMWSWVVLYYLTRRI
jgi:hypothetical protein